MTTQQHLEWLLYLQSENPEGWRLHCRRRARDLAKEPEHAELPQLLDEAMKAAAPASTSPAP